eukprot:TRINITY_DN1414_c0_g2_i1.p1 TRINITY_DN1414_c0_g2~~TRINITY_DN1414_c0_g2_i1.p1  ORF type:complete len:1160 (+),score=284.10 TRINITY_DN1414_c0_g2_i1:187-3480(+)
MWVMASAGTAADTVVAVFAVQPGKGASVHTLEYQGGLLWETEVDWSPIVSLEVSLNDSYDVPPNYELQYIVTWIAKGGNRSFTDTIKSSCNQTAAEDKCGSVSVPKQSVRRGTQAPYGGPIAVYFEIVNASQEILDDPSIIVADSVTMSPIFSNFATYSGAMAMLTIGAYIIRYIYMLCHTSEKVTPDQVVAAVLMPLFFLQLQSVFSVAFLGSTSSSVDSDKLRRYLTVCPYIFTHALQAAVLGLFKYSEPRNEMPYAKMAIWFTVMTFLSTYFAFRAHTYEEDIVATAWDLQTGIKTNTNNGLAVSYIWLRWAFVVYLVRKVKVSRKAFLHVPYLVYRNKYLKNSLVNMIGVAMFIHEFGTIGSSIISVAPIQGTSLGRCWNYAVILLGLGSALMPVYVRADDSLPPPPTSDEWKKVTWTVEWKKWFARNAAAKTLYYFIESEEELAFWEIQNKGECEPMNDQPALCVRPNIGVSFKTILQVFMYCLQVVCLQFIIFCLWMIGIMGLCFPWLLKQAAYWQRRTVAKHLEALYDIHPKSRIVGMFPVEASENTLKANLCNKYTYLALVFGQMSMWMAYANACVTMILGVSGVVFSWFFITSSVGALLLTCQHVATALMLKVQRGLAVCLLVEGSEVVGSVPTEETQEHVVAPFCLQTCVTMSHLAYEAYRQCPGIDEQTIAEAEPVDSKSGGIFTGWLPKSGLVSANVLAPGSKIKDRRIDVARYGLDLKYVGIVSGLQFLVGVWKEANAVFVSFRGTANVANKKTDLEFRRKPWKDMVADVDKSMFRFLSCWGATPMIHRGFASLWDTVSPVVCDQIETLRGEFGYERVFVTGHSLGAAVATLAAYSLAKKYGSSAVGLYAFGTPLLGNQAFANYMNFRVPYNMNLCHENDACTRAAGTFANVQSGQDIRVGRCGQLLVNPLWVEKSFAPWGNGGNPFAAHKIVRYQTSLCVASGLFDCGMLMLIGEENKTTDQVAWVHGRSRTRYPVGLEVGIVVKGAVRRARLISFPNKKTARVRVLDLPPFDVPVTALGLPPPASPTPTIALHPLPTDMQVVVGKDSDSVTTINPTLSPNQPPLNINYQTAPSEELPPPPLV